MEIDLRRNGQLTISQSKEISLLEPEVRNEYNAFIGELAEKNNLSGLAWLLQATCRNTHLSLIHDSFCRIKLLKNILMRGEHIERVLVDSKSLMSICESIVHEYKSDAKVKLTGNARYGRLILFRNIIKSAWLLLNIYVWPKVIRGKRVPNSPIIYLDNFIFIDSFDSKGELNDRYYPGLIDGVISGDIKNKIWYVSTMIGIKTPKHFRSIFNSIRQSSQNIIVKEDWLTLGDYIYSFISSLILPLKIKKIPLWGNVNVDELVVDELKIDRCSTSLNNSLLQYIFIKRLRKSGIDLDMVIDWNENQTIDRAVNLAVKKYYPGVKVKGYQGYVVPDFYACKDPTCYELEAGTVPDEICVVGQAFVENKKLNCRKLNINVVPAFRFLNIHKVKNTGYRDSNLIVIVLPISIDECKEIIEISEKLTVLLGTEYRFIVKQHPTYTREKFQFLLPKAKNKVFTYTNETTYELLKKCRLLVSASSSVCLEAAISGTPVAIIGSRSGPVKNPLANFDALKAWKVCYSELDIEHFLAETNHDINVPADNYFEPVTEDGLGKLLA